MNPGLWPRILSVPGVISAIQTHRQECLCHARANHYVAISITEAAPLMTMRETVHLFRSEHLGNERFIWIRRPPGGDDRCVIRQLVVVLDAEFYRERMDAVTLWDELEAHGEIAPAWVVFVSMHSFEARWKECPCHVPFALFVGAELLPWLAHLHPELADSAVKRVLVGLSYTGLAAAFVALERPGLFDHVITQSGSFWWNDCWLASRVAALDQPIPTAFYLDVGDRETARDVRHADVLQVVSQIEGVDRFEAALRATGHEVVRVDFEGGHDFASWKRTLPGALRRALPPEDSF